MAATAKRAPTRRTAAVADEAAAPATPPGKRERLVGAATDLFHRQGVERTTLADIAQAADVPLGNVYYYFKTKDLIVAAVVQARVEMLRAGLAALADAHPTPQARLKAWLEELAGQSELIARFGCPFGTLSIELEKRAEGADAAAAQLLQTPIDWAAAQFREMGLRDSDGLAVQLIAAYQGAAALSLAAGSPALMKREARRVEKWVDSLAA